MKNMRDRKAFKRTCLIMCFVLTIIQCQAVYGNSDFTENSAQGGAYVISRDTSSGGTADTEEGAEITPTGGNDVTAAPVTSVGNSDSSVKSELDKPSDEPALSPEILEMIDEDNIAPIGAEEYEESYVVDMAVPTRLMFMIDPFNMTGNGTVSSTLIPVVNKSEFPVVFSVGTVEVIKNDPSIQLSPNPVDQDTEIKDKIIEIKMVWKDRDGREEPRLLTGPTAGGIYERILEPDEEIDFYITGSLTSNAKKKWRNDDIELNFTISMDKAPDEVPEEPAEDIPEETPENTGTAPVTLPEPVNQPKPSGGNEGIYSTSKDTKE